MTVRNCKKLLRRLKKQLAETDGSYPLLQKIAAAADSKGTSALLRRKDGTLLPLLEELFDEYRSDLRPGTLRQAILQSSRKKGAFRDAELFALPDLLALCGLRLLVSAPQNEREETLHAVSGLLKSTEEGGELRLRELYRAVSGVDAILRRQNPLCYARCDEQTRHQIRQEVYRLAKQKRLSEIDAALLYCRGSCPRSFPGWGYFALWGTLFLLFQCGSFLLLGLPAIWLVLPFSELAKGICDGILSAKLPPRPIPRLEPGPIPDDARTLVVITTLLTGRDEPLFRRLEMLWRQNRDANLRFGLLGDLPECDQYACPEDEKILLAAEKELDALRQRCGDHFDLYVRSRVKQPGTGRFCGWERKRGALLELCRLADGEDTTSLQLLAGDLPFLRQSRYIVTLDADTEMKIGAVRELVFTMLHPANRPVIREGAVREGHALLQPAVLPSLAAACASPFTVMLTGSGGSDPYQSSAKDLMQTLFGRGIYCGKGIFDRAAYRKVLDGAFPENKILSHDLAEGTRLRAGVLPELPLFDGCPKSAEGWFRRQHRWLRGDFQSLPLSFCRVENADGEKVRNPIGRVERFWILDNFRRAFIPVAACAAILRALWLPKKAAAAMLLLALGYLFLPVVRAIFRFRGRLFRRFYSNVLEGSWHALCEALFRTVSLFHTARITLDAFIRAVWRTTVSHRNCLEWVTAAESDQSDSCLRLYRGMFPSVAAGILLIACAPEPLHRLLGIGFLACPFLAWLVSLPYPPERDPGEKRKELLTGWCRDAFRFFENTVGAEEHYLPPDNLQLLPKETVAHRTSPTNIAMYLLSLLAAADFGFLSPDALCERLENTLETVEALPKYRGLLYNWYDTRSLEVLGSPYLSSVDCGNYLCALVTLREGLREYEERCQDLKAVGKRLTALEEASDLGLLYNREKELFCIGYDPLKNEQSEGCYDLLMSESRLTGYYAIARGIVPAKHWARLGRPLIGRTGHIGVSSWSGTAFEYFLPALLLRSFPGSLSYEALGFALCEQMADPSPRGDFWGRSESGYFAFDADMNYQYRAFGCDRLAMDQPSGEQVFAPYGVFLALCCSYSLPIRALQKMKAMGLYGKYGFFEAIDMTPARVGEGHAVIHSYMAHHTGMLLCACCNACFENKMQRRFLRDGDMAAATELLCERIPVDARVRSCRKPLPKEPHPQLMRMPVALLQKDEPGDSSAGGIPASALLSGGLQIFADADGNLAIRAGENAVSLPNMRGEEVSLRTVRLLLSDGKRCFDCLRGPGIRIENRGDRLRFIRDLPAEKIHTEAEILPAGDAPFLALRLTAEGAFTAIRAVLTLEPILCHEKDYFAHPDYHRLRLCGKYREKERLLFFRRLPVKPEERPIVLGLTTLGGGKQEVLARLDDALPRQYREEDLRALCEKPFPPLAGTALQIPFCVLRKSAVCRTGRYRETFLLGVCETAEEFSIEACRLRQEGAGALSGYRDAMRELADRQYRSAGILPRERRYETLLLTGLLHRSNVRGGSAPMGDLWRYGISGDLPIVCLHCQGDTLTAAGRTLLRGFLRAHRLLRIKGFRFDLVLLYRRGEQYTDAGRQSMEAAAGAHCAPGVIGRPGGVHLLAEEALPTLRAFADLFGSIGEDSLPETVFRQSGADRLPGTVRTLPLPVTTTAGKVIAAFPHGKLLREGFLMPAADAPTGRPFSQIYAGAAFGTLVKQHSLGWSWFGNAALFPLTKRPDCELPEAAGERLLLFCGEKGSGYDLAACAGETLFGDEEARWSGETPEGISYRLSAGTAGKFPLKIVRLHLRNRSDNPCRVRAEYRVRPDLGSPGFLESADGQTRFFRGCRESEGWGMFLFSPSAAEDLSLSPGGTGELRFLLGPIRFTADRAYYALLERFGKPVTELPPPVSPLAARFTLRSGDPALDALFNRYLPRQVVCSRLWGRCGPDQCGGAWGFRDQLQDCMNLLEWQPAFLKWQLLRCAARQYYQGDVQHWWHKDLAASLPPENEKSVRARTGAGLRSRCGDDLLWLPYALARYLAVTGDRGFPQMKVAYLDSPALSPGESERYESALPTDRKETLYAHGMRAIEPALSRLGENGLPLFGDGDWNDGMSAIGAGGKGESVWLGQFLLLVLREYAPLAAAYGTEEDRKRIAAAENALIRALDGWFYGDRYARGSFDDGRRFGIPGCGECELDLLPQAFAAIVGLPHADTAMDTAVRELWEEKSGIWKLLSPPFAGGRLPFAGRIEGYAPGLRENGGQYTHGALFGVWGLLSLGRTEEAWKIFKRLLPTEQAKRPDYGGEPYAIAADLAAAEGLSGRVGWTFYTGAAGWTLHLLLCYFLGYREAPDGFTLSPVRGPGDFTLTVEKKGTLYEIEIRQSGGQNRLDGKPIPATFRFPFDRKRHRAEISLPG